MLAADLITAWKPSRAAALATDLITALQTGQGGAASMANYCERSSSWS